MKKIKDSRIKLTVEAKQEIIKFCKKHPTKKKVMAEKYGITLRYIQILCAKTNIKVDLENKKVVASYLMKTLEDHLDFCTRHYPGLYDLEDLTQIAILKSSVYDYKKWLEKQLEPVKNSEPANLNTYFIKTPLELKD